MKVVKAALALVGVAAVALYVAVVILIELLARLLPLIALAALVVAIVCVWRKIRAHKHPAARRVSTPIITSSGHLPAGPPEREQVVPARALALVAHHPTRLIVGGETCDHAEDGYLRLGPSPDPASTAGRPYVVSGGRSHARRVSPRARPRSTRP